MSFSRPGGRDSPPSSLNVSAHAGSLSCTTARHSSPRGTRVASASTHGSSHPHPHPSPPPDDSSAGGRGRGRKSSRAVVKPSDSASSMHRHGSAASPGRRRSSASPNRRGSAGRMPRHNSHLNRTDSGRVGKRALANRRRSSHRLGRRSSGVRGEADSKESDAEGEGEGEGEDEAEVLGPHRSALSRWLATRMYYSPDDISATHFQR